MTNGMIGGAIVAALLLILLVWAMCVVAGRADDRIERYLAEQRKRVREHGCARKNRHA